MPPVNPPSALESPRFPMLEEGKPELPPRPQNRPRRRSRSAEPARAIRSSSDFVSLFARELPTPPATATATTAPTEETIERDGGGDTSTEIQQETAPARTPPAVPEFVPGAGQMPPSSKSVEKWGSVGAKPLALQRLHSESAVPSIMPALLQQQQHRDDETRPASLASAGGEHMPPSPPLTRRSTNASTRSLSNKYALVRRPTPPPHQQLPHPSPAQVPEINIARPSTAGSSISLKDVRKAGKHLGQNPIDYLIPHGSLPAPVSGYFHPMHDPCSLDVPPSMRVPDVNPVKGIFHSLNFLLDSYLDILSSGGSLAVGTGYHSVARKLLERVETLFGRDLGVDGMGWVDVLEYLRGSRTKPFLCVLPVRGLLAINKKDDELVLRRAEPVSTARELAESVVAGIKTKPAMSKVEQWLEEVGQVLKASGADEASKAGGQSLTKEDEDEEDRMVCEIIEGILKSNTEENQIKNFRRYLEDRVLIANTKRALTRLYNDHPAESITPPIVALYMLLHPDLHPLLRALANVSEPELELINSGRFDSFLDGSTNVVARDEDEELSVISSLDKRLWTVLEGLEDEIEELHTRALVVRRALKSRRECISRNKRSSRSSSPVSTSSKPDEHHHHGHHGHHHHKRQKDEDEWAQNVPTLHLPITPDDSASNIASNRRRRQERASKLNDDDDRRTKDKERKREKKAAKKEHLSLKDFAIKSGEFGPGSTIEEEKSDAAGAEGGTVLNGKRKKRKDRDRSRNRCGECGSCVGEDEKRKERKEKRKEEKEKEKDKEKRNTVSTANETDSLKSRGRPSPS